MSSPRRAAKGGSSKPASAKPKIASDVTASAQATQLAAELERGLAEGRLDAVSPQARQQLLAALCKVYSLQVQGGDPSLPLLPQSGVSPTDVMIMAGALLRAADLQVFELGMWQSWTGR
jgi:hypothetical protein